MDSNLNPVEPPSPPIHTSNRVPFWVIVVIPVLVLITLGVIGFVGLHMRRSVRQVVKKIVNLDRSGQRDRAVAVASRPVEWTSNTVTMAKVAEKQKAFRVRQYLEGYQNVRGHNLACEAETVTAIKTWLDYYYGGGLQTNFSAMANMLNTVLKNPACDDPLVWTLAGALSDELHEGMHRFERAVNGYPQSHYPAYPRFYATVMLADKLTRLHDKSGRVQELDTAATKLLAEALRDGSIQPEDQDIIAEILITGWGQGYVHRNWTSVISVAVGAGESFKWMALMLEGWHQVRQAWTARGTGYANTVTEAGWKGFHEHLAAARTAYTKAWDLRPDFPLAAIQMLTVSLGTSGIEEMRLWFDRAVAGQVDHPDAWAGLRWGLWPRWYGSHEAMLAFGVTALNTRRFDTDVPRNLYDSISDIESDRKLPRGQHIYGRKDIWPHLQRMYEGYIAEPAQAKTRVGWRSTYSVVAYLAGKYDVARTQLEAINWTPLRNNLSGWGRELSLMPMEVAARTGTVAPQVEAAEACCNHGDFAGALQIYTQLNDGGRLDGTRAFVTERLTTLTLEQRLAAHDWVDFLPATDNLVGWAIARGKWRRLPDGALEVETGEDGHIIYARAQVRGDFEVRGSFEVVRSSNQSFQAGLVMGLPQFGCKGWYGFRMKRNADEGDVVSFAEGWTKQLVQPFPLDNQTNTFYFRFQHGHVSASVNNKEILKNAPVPETHQYPSDHVLLGFGAYSDANETIIRYRAVQVRQLSTPAGR